MNSTLIKAISILLITLMFGCSSEKEAAKTVPQLTTTTATNITLTSASTGGNVSADGGDPITSKGVVWNTATAPTINLATKTADGTGIASFTSVINNLNPSTSYYARAYATNSVGTAYGNEITFTTGAIVLPTLTTTAITSITSNSAVSGGTIIADAGKPILAKGVVWSTSTNPTISLTTKTNDGVGLGTFSSTISGLSANTVYYLKAYATNSTGTAYGNEITFTTSNIDIYAAGYEYDRAVVLKNNQKILSTNLGSISTIAKSVYVNGTDVYAVGSFGSYGNYSSVLWKNGTPTYLEQSGHTSNITPNSVFVSGTNVYVAGSGLNRAKIWKNNMVTILTPQDDDGNANAVYVSGSDIYVTGANYTSTRLDGGGPVIWKNGVMSYLNQNGGAGVANSIFVSGGNVYVAGDIDGNPVYWKNGVLNFLSKVTSNGTGDMANVKSIYVNGSDVYVTGSMNVTGGVFGAGPSAILWKNGIASEITNPSNSTYTHGIANSVVVVGSEVYIAGIYAGNNDTGGDRGFIWSSTKGWIYTTAQRAGLFSIFVPKP